MYQPCSKAETMKEVPYMLKYSSIAERLDCSVSTVKRLLSVAGIQPWTIVGNSPLFRESDLYDALRDVRLLSKNCKKREKLN